MEIAELINHPEQLDRETLYELRSLLALYPYFQTARLLMLQNLYLLHDPTFDEELRRAAIYITDRKVIFQMIEGAHYRLRTLHDDSTDGDRRSLTPSERDSRTLSLIDNFLESLPKDDPDDGDTPRPRRKPTPADAAVDYVAYLMESEYEPLIDDEQPVEVPQLKGQSLIDTFINQDKGRFQLDDNPTLLPDIEPDDVDAPQVDPNTYFTEETARIHIKQGSYLQALEIIRHLSLVNPKKNAYFADQIRFLEKLIINNNKK